MDTALPVFRARGVPTAGMAKLVAAVGDGEQSGRNDFEWLWRSQGGSLYVFAGDALVCVCVHSAAFRGWIGKTAIRRIHRTNGNWCGWQAFRVQLSGALADWQPVSLQIRGDTMTKIFSGSVPARLLVYGHVERYYRVRPQ